MTEINTKTLVEKLVLAEKCGRTEGIKEVVNWLAENTPIFLAGADTCNIAGHALKGFTSYYLIRYKDLEEKLKEWGIQLNKERGL